MLPYSYTRSLQIFRRCRLLDYKPWLCPRLMSSELNSEASDSTNQNENKTVTWDIVVSGGGLVGSAMACALANSEVLDGKRILLLEGGPEITRHNLPEKYSNRVSALNPGSKRFLDEIGAWTKITQLRMKPVKRMQVWESQSNSLISFEQTHFEENIAYIVENNVVLRALAECLSNLKDSVSVWNGVKVKSYELPNQSSPSNIVQINLEDGRLLETKLLIGADGFNSLVRKTMGAQNISWNYNQQAIVATLTFSEPIENNVAWQKFLPTGPIAFLPLTDISSSLVWTVTPKLAEQLMSMNDDAFTDALNSAMWNDKAPHPLVKNSTIIVERFVNNFFPSVGSTVQLPPSILSVEKGSRATFPLGLGHSTKYIGPNVALIGDSAHRVHPLAGLGVNLGFGDAKCLTKKIIENVYNGNFIGFSHGLAAYETERQRHNVPAMVAIDGINKLYSNDFLPLVLLRSVGLQLTNLCPPLKKRFMDVASR